jgi:DNA replication ATP-dependent helicase Dna2
VISLLSSDEKENSQTDIRRPDRSQVVENQNEKLVSPTDNKAACPSTPASRLALNELVGMGDVERLVETISPDDRVEWDHSKDSSQESTPFQGIRRANKRARSSSPVASSPAYGRGGQPQLDPGSELWVRYSLNGPNATTPLRPHVPALAHLRQTSSPQPSREGITTPRELSSFRRANSCGTTFPKRRRIGGADGDVFTEPANIGPSRLHVLIESVQQCMSQQKPHIPANESCSPLDAARRDAQSPTFDAQQNPQSPEFVQNAMSSAKTDRQERQASVETNLSDYGEFDDEELDSMDLDALDSQSAAQTVTKARTPEPLPPALTRRSSLSSRKAAAPVLVEEGFVGSVKGVDDDDEFGDFDDEVFGDLEDVVSQFDTRAPVLEPTKALHSLPPVGKALQKADSDDEFGDDEIDENDFEAAVAATQSIRKTNDLLPVRPRYS